jgi:hypothetical protein
MSVTVKQLEAFHRFGAEQLASGQGDLSWDELFTLWESRNNRDEANAAIREGLADIDSGQFQSADAALVDIRRDFGISE